jgi:hypothetical protein
MIGQRAREKGWLTDDDILRILVIQEETRERFGGITIREKYLSKEQVDQLLKEQSDSYMYFGEALAKIEALSYDEVIKQLQEFTERLIKHQFE